MDSLYYDGKCALCNREIRFLKKHANNLQFIDIHSLDNKEAMPDTPVDAPDKETLLKTLHLFTTEKVWLKGVDATVRNWQHTPYGWIMRPLKWPVITIFARKVYAYWAVKRYCNLYE